jgi:hypothetical protein
LLIKLSFQPPISLLASRKIPKLHAFDLILILVIISL